MTFNPGGINVKVMIEVCHSWPYPGGADLGSVSVTTWKEWD